MKTLLKKTTLIICLIVFGLQICPAFAYETADVFVNGQKIVFDQPAILKDDRILVPVRGICEALNCKVEWDDKTETAIISDLTLNVRITVDVPVLTKSLSNKPTEEIKIDVPPMLYNDRLFVPVRAIAEAFSAKVEWNEEKKQVEIYTSPKEEEKKDDVASKLQTAKQQYELGLKYEKGDGVPKNETEAERFFKIAADYGYPEAQNKLGDCYYYGKGISQNYPTAMIWYRKAADNGFAKAMNNLGLCYVMGTGATIDYKEGAKWLLRGAELGDMDAQYNIGLCYTYGSGVERNFEEAARWFKAAAEQGHGEAQYNVGVCYENGRGLEQNSKEAQKWYKKAEENNYKPEGLNYGIYVIITNIEWSRS